jgi:hypothetical protein
MTLCDGDLPTAFFAFVDSRIRCADSRFMGFIKFDALIRRQKVPEFIGCHICF